MIKPTKPRAHLLDLNTQPGWTNGRHRPLPRIDGELFYQKSTGGYEAEAGRGIARAGARDHEKYPSLISGEYRYRKTAETN